MEEVSGQREQQLQRHWGKNTVVGLKTARRRRGEWEDVPEEECSWSDSGSQIIKKPVGHKDSDFIPK